MRIAFVIEHYSKRMGYIENCLPKHLARLGADVHVITTNLQANYRAGADYREIYEQFLGPVEVPCGTEIVDGVTVHRLPHEKRLGYARVRGLGLTQKLHALRPDIVQVQGVGSWMPLEAAFAQRSVAFKLFTAAHQAESSIAPDLRQGPRWSLSRVRSDVRRAIPGWIVSLRTEKCYAATTDCAEVAFRFYGVPKAKIEVCPLGVDTDVFHPSLDQESTERRDALRQSWGFSPTDIVCIYTGRLTESKNPLWLAQAVDRLRGNGEPYRAIFVGNGPQSEAIQQCQGCVVHRFVPWCELPDFYRAADVAVWPRWLSISQLDAIGCGLPIVLSDQIAARERIEDNGFTYKEGDVDDLMNSLVKLRSLEQRCRMGQIGWAKIRGNFSWTSIAETRLRDYQASLEGGENRLARRAA